MSYEELVKRLRDYSAARKGEIAELTAEAADAIEELANWWSMAKTLGDMVMPKWISVAERLPKYGTPVLAYGSRGGIFVAKYERARAEWDIDYWWKLNSSIHVCNPTHWMPLPEPPKEETE